MADNKGGDFRDWDIDVETSTGGLDKLGMPFYLWRESADNRLSLGRPRYCCVMPVDGVLQFVFFNPSEDVKSTGTARVMVVVAAIVTVVMLILGYYERQTATGDYISDTSVPPFLILVMTFFMVVFACGIIGGGWYACVTLFRWVTGRFEGDGRTVMMPWRSLEGFQVINASQAGAVAGEEATKTGHGMTAVFDDGSQVILTGNAWNYRSIADQHRDMTMLFCRRRDEFAKPWEDAARNASKRDGAPPASQGNNSIPQKL